MAMLCIRSDGQEKRGLDKSRNQEQVGYGYDSGSMYRRTGAWVNSMGG